MSWLITLGILILIAAIPLGVSLVYDEDGVLIRIIAGVLKFRVFPLPKKEKKPKKGKNTKKDSQSRSKKKAESSAQSGDEAQKTKSGGSISDFLPLVNVLLKFLDGFRRKLRVNVLELKLIMAAEDPCDLAVNYGRAWAAVGNLMPQLERVFVIKKRNIEVECDFTADKTRVLARLDLTITVGRMLGLFFVLLGRAAVELMKIMMKRKGGAVNEPESS